MTYTENVKRGAALLDREWPGWRNEMNLRTLDLSDGCYCILGQVFGYYDAGLSALLDIDTQQFRTDEWFKSIDFQAAVAHGFCIDLPHRHCKWQALQEAWLVELGVLPLLTL